MVNPKRLLPGAIPLCRVALGLCLFASLSSAQSAPILAPYKWEPVRIVGGGYIPSLIAHPKQSGLIYARTTGGGVYRWNPTTQEWIPLLDFLVGTDNALMGPESVALDPTDPTRLYIAAGTSGPESALLVSTNQGATFTINRNPGFQMAPSNNGANAGERLAVNPSNPSELFMGTRSQGLWKSENNAQTWAKVNSFPVSSSADGYGVNFVLFDPVNSGTVYAGVYTTETIYKSTDDGTTWTALPNQPLSWPFSVTGTIRPPEPLRAVINPDGNLYVTYQSFEGPGPNPVGLTYGLVEKFNPSAGTWTNITPPLDTKDGETTQTGGYCGITQDPNRQGTVAVATLNRSPSSSSSSSTTTFSDTIFITHDGGNTWIDLGAITSSGGVYASEIPAGFLYFGPSVFLPVSPWLDAGYGAPVTGFGYYMSGLLIDPVNPEHLLYGTTGTIFATENVSAADSGKSPTWSVQALGIEASYVPEAISPTEGAHLLSGALGGFRHDDFAVSPPGGTFSGQGVLFGNIDGLDWAGQNPLFIAAVGVPDFPTTGPCNWGGYSTDGGTTWTPFNGCATNAATTLNNPGTIIVDASGTMIMWTPPGSISTSQYSTDGNGGIWTLATGLPQRFTPVADKVAPKTFYSFDGASFYSTASSGGTAFSKVSKTTFTRGMTPFLPVANFARAGDLWLPASGFGLYHSSDGGVNWTALPNVLQANMVTLGAPNPRARKEVQTIFVYGVIAGASTYGIFRSDDNGTTWVQVNDPAHQYGGPSVIAADTRVYGRIFVGTSGRGIVYGDILTEPLGGSGLGPQ